MGTTDVSRKSLERVTRPRAGKRVRLGEAPRTPFKEAHRCRCQPCTYTALRGSASLNGTSWASGLCHPSLGSVFPLHLRTAEPQWSTPKGENDFLHVEYHKGEESLDDKYPLGTEC